MPSHLYQHQFLINRKNRESIKRQKAKVIWFTGLSGSGKSTLANLLEEVLHAKGYHTYVLDGDNVRSGLNQDLQFSTDDRRENIRRIAEVANLFVDAGIIVIAAFITPLESARKMIKQLIGEEDYIQIYVNTPIAVCEKRDIKGLYKKARNGEIRNFTGISSPYEEPLNNDIIIYSDKEEKEVSLNKIVEFVLPKIQI